MMADDISNLLALLQKIAAEHNYANPDIKISAIFTGGANYSSRLYLNKITSDGKEDLRLFAKIAAIQEKMREQVTMQVYDNERFVYSELIMMYRELEEKSGLSKEHKLSVPKYYGADATRMQEILVLEDMACQGFTLHPRTEPVTWDYAAAAVSELSKFHALSLAFQHQDPAGFERVANMLPHGIYTDHQENHTFYNGSAKTALASVREENKEKLQRFLDGTCLAQFGEAYRALRRPVIIHGDFRPSNMLHRRSDDGTLEVMVVDYQTIQAGCPVIDLLYFIFTATDGEFRAQHYQRLVEHYHAELGAALARLGLDVSTKYPRDEFQFELKEKLSYGLQLSVMVLPPLLMAEEDAPPMGGDFTMASMADLHPGERYVTRINQIVDDYVNWGVLG